MHYDETTQITSWVFTMLGKEIGKIYKNAGRRLFARNIRGFLGNTDINRGLKETLKGRPEYFWYFNNGITIIGDSVSTDTSNGQKYLYISNPQIINGQQTTRALAEEGKANSTVLVKLITVNRDTLEGRLKYGQLVSDIVSATNFQNEISLSDLRSNDQEQIRLERELRKWNILYIRKRQSKAEMRQIHGSKYKLMIKKDDLARSVAGCLFDPAILRLGKERLFDDTNYLKIFNGRPVLEYLNYYWINQAARWRVAGSEQGYARWLVVHFMWSQIGDNFRKPAFATWFCESIKKYNTNANYIYPLLAAFDIAYTSAMSYYRKNRKGKSGILDASSFFKHSKHHIKFNEYWESKENSKRKRRFLTQLDKFIKGVYSLL
jgi:hypothetical protein